MLGAGLGMLFAPKAGSEVRKQLSEQANRLRSTANDTIQQASEKLSQVSQQASEKIGQVSEKVSQIVDRGREAYDRAKAPAAETAATVPAPFFDGLSHVGAVGSQLRRPGDRCGTPVPRDDSVNRVVRVVGGYDSEDGAENRGRGARCGGAWRGVLHRPHPAAAAIRDGARDDRPDGRASRRW